MPLHRPLILQNSASASCSMCLQRSLSSQSCIWCCRFWYDSKKRQILRISVFPFIASVDFQWSSNFQHFSDADVLQIREILIGCKRFIYPCAICRNSGLCRPTWTAANFIRRQWNLRLFWDSFPGLQCLRNNISAFLGIAPCQFLRLFTCAALPISRRKRLRDLGQALHWTDWSCESPGRSRLLLDRLHGLRLERFRQLATALDFNQLLRVRIEQINI